MTEEQRGADDVGPVLEPNELGRAIAGAIKKRHANVAIVDRGAYLRVSVPLRCVALRADVEEILGRALSLPGDLETVMPSFKGKLTIHDDEIVWAFRERA